MKVLLNDQLVEYKDEGEGKVVLLLHGWGSNLSAFNQLSDSLKKRFRVIRLDFPGFGGSPQPKQDWDIGEYANFVHRFLSKLKIPELYAIGGHSFGGRVIIKGISMGKLNPRRVILLDAAGIKPSQSNKKNFLKLIAKAGKAITSLPGLRGTQSSLKKALYKAAGSTDYLDAGTMRQIFLKTIGEDLTNNVASINQPTLIVWGEDDVETPVSDADKMHRLIKNSQLVIVPEAGHFVFVDDFLAVDKEIGAFL